MNAVATSRAMVREISTSISLFVRVRKMHYSSEVRRTSVLFVMGRLLVFVHKVLHFLYSLVYMTQSNSVLIFLSFIIHKSKYFVTVSEKYTFSFFYGDHCSSSIFVNCLACLAFAWLPSELKKTEMLITEDVILSQSIPYKPSVTSDFFFEEVMFHRCNI